MVQGQSVGGGGGVGLWVAEGKAQRATPCLSAGIGIFVIQVQKISTQIVY